MGKFAKRGTLDTFESDVLRQFGPITRGVGPRWTGAGAKESHPDQE